MNRQIQAISNDMGALAEDVRALMTATADVADETVVEARKRLAAALNGCKTILEHVKAKAIEGVKATNQVMHKHPYQAIGIAFGVAAIVTCLIARRCTCKCD